jgi:hypothetical protein
MAITKPAVRQSWANVAIPVTDIVDPGDAYVAAGWVESSTPPSRQFFNWLLNYASNGVRYFSRRGVADYDAAETYQIGDIVIGDLGILMQSLTAGQIGNLPSTSTVNWAPLKNYPNATQVGALITTALASYETTAALTTTLASYVTNAVLGATLAAYVTNTSLASTLSAYATNAALALKANAANAVLTGVPVAPTATVGTNTAQLATTAFCQGSLAVAEAYANGTFGSNANGFFMKLPGGMIVQFGYNAVAGGTTATQVFPIDFPGSCGSINLTPAGANATLHTSVPSASNHQFSITNGASGTGTNWMAMGD